MSNARLALPSMEDLCRSVLENNRATISVKKPAMALRKLELILAAALELSNRGGFQAMSLRELSRASGVSMGGMYAYFDSKTALLDMILSEVTGAVERTLGAAPDTLADDPRARLMWLIDAHVRLTEAMLPWFSFAFMEAKNFPVAARRRAVESEARTERYFDEVVAQGIAAGQFAPTTPALLPALIKPLLQDWYVKRGKYRRRGVDIDTYIATVQDIVLAACGRSPEQHESFDHD